MEIKNGNIIKTQIFQITLADEIDANIIQDGISALQNTRTSYLLNAILEKFASKNEVVQFDTIELNLGAISKANYENELLYRIEEEFNSFLNRHILANGTVLTGKKIVLTDFKLEQFEHFLIQGYTSWNSSLTYKPSSLFEELILQNEEALKNVLNKHVKNESIRKRLVFQFNDKLLSKLITLVAKDESSYILNYRENIIAQQNAKPILKIESTKFRDSVWEVILAYIFVQTGGYHNKKSFLKYLLEKISEKHGISFKKLLQQLSEALQLNSSLLTGSIEFKKIIFELEQDESPNSTFSIDENIGDDQTIANWIKQVDYYLQTGNVLAPPSHSISRQEFNAYLFHLLQSKNEMAIRFLNNWLFDSAKKERLLQLSKPPLQEEFKKHISFFFITINNQFIKALELHRVVLSVNCDKLLKNISKMKTKLFLKAFHPTIHSEKDAVIYFLRSILQEFIQKNDILFQLLERIKDKMPLSYKTAIANFTSEFKQEIEAQFIKAHTLEILNFIENNSFYLWGEWGARHFEIWSQKLNISEKQLFQKLEKSNPPNNVTLYLKYIKSDKKNINPFKNNLPPEAYNVLKTKVFFVFKNGTLPWWAKSYTEEKFNIDFSTLWASPNEKKELLQFLRNEKSLLEGLGFIDQNNFSQLLKAVSKSSQKYIVDFTLAFLSFIKQDILPVGIVSKHEISVFKMNMAHLFLFKSSISYEERTLAYIQEWLKSSKVINTESAKQLLCFFITRSRKNLGSNSFNQKLKSFILVNLNLEKEVQPILSEAISLSDFIRLNFYHDVSVKYFSEKKSIILHLKEIIETSPHTFFNWLSRAEFRTVLLSQLDEQETSNLIEVSLSRAQKEHFVGMLDFMDNYSTQLSTKEKMALKKLYFKLVLLKLSSGGFASWNLKEWVLFVFAVFTQILGKQKSLKIIFSVKKKSLSSKKQQSKILNIIFETVTFILPNKTEKQKYMEQDKKYKKLGEQVDREFLDPIYINNAGLIIVAPFLGMLFEKCQLFENNTFRDDECSYKAIHLLEYAATGKPIENEQGLVIHKVLCGINLNTPIDTSILLTDTDKEIVDSLLHAITQQWTPLKETSIEGLQTSFFQRDGKLEEEAEAYFLRVEQKAFDMLLDQIPWNITKIKLSWMKKILQVTWR